ncbi:MAG TPA: NAD(P)H-quinone oxidoreductase [Ferrovibrio sp.]|uniref:NAD(P)H-quinone oxidoreductase n=1 Tax=Ferrovibrio sp. TaxID=1917215 RepID=UPI002B4AF2F6|nr:NAD(P)H-quinone oxidoreductase [Ferrovibrio sp.]HLT78998.1 NAD(P)H-quinone oxidoreductase [Ferrovibrio sp.]
MLPQEMTVIEISQPGGPEVLKPASRPMPRPGAGEVLIKVAAAGVNRPDVLQRAGMYPPPPGAPDYPGLEVAGEIAALGPDVQHWKVGDKVCALVTGGGYATYCVAPAEQCLPVPQGLDITEAAALPENWFTVWTNIADRGQLRAGESILIHGGASGIGVAAIQLAKLLGAGRIFATAGTDEKCRFCESLGAEKAINYKTEDFAARIAELTGGKGVDVILDMVGGKYFAPNIKSLAEEGRLVIIAVQGGPKGEGDLSVVMRKRLTVTGSTLRPRPVAFKGAIARALEEKVWPAFADGRLKVIVDSRFPLAQAAEAHARIDHADHVGKILLTT